jgi:hypothetical protein
MWKQCDKMSRKYKEDRGGLYRTEQNIHILAGKCWKTKQKSNAAQLRSELGCSTAEQEVIR